MLGIYLVNHGGITLGLDLVLVHIFSDFFFTSADVTPQIFNGLAIFCFSVSSGKQVFLVLVWRVDVLVLACLEF